MTNRISLIRGGVAVLMVIGAGAGGYWVATAPQRMAVAQPQLAVSPDHLDFGEVWEDPAFVWKLPFENVGTSEVRVVDFVSPCGCTAIDPPTLTIPTGATRSVRIEINLRYRPGGIGNTGDASEVSGNGRAFSAQIGARLQGPHGETMPPVIWTLQGRVRPLLTMDPPDGVWFGDSLVRGQPFASRSVMVTAHAPLVSLGAKCEPDVAVVTVKRRSTKDAKHELIIRPREELKVGALKATVTLQPRGEDGTLPYVTFPITGQVVEDIQALPARIQLGAFAVGQRISETVVLRSSSGTPFDVEEVKCLSQHTMIENVKEEPSRKEYRITQRILHLDNQFETVSFHVKAKGDSTRVVSVEVGYLGIAE